MRFADGSRRWVPLPEGLSHAEAVARAEVVAAEARRRASPVDLTTLTQPGETLAEWSERWLTSRVQTGYRSTKDDRSRLKVHILPLIGGVKIAALSTDDVERVRDRLDARVRAGEIAWGTAQLTWALLKSMCKAARLSKDRELRVRRDDPTRDVAPPDRGIVKAKQFLYPSEFLKLVSCEEVPLAWRRAVVLSVYLLLRQSELQALAWDDLDLEHGVAHIHRSVDRADRAADKTTKTETTRRLAIEPTLMPLLLAMHDQAGKPKSGRVLADLPPWYDLAKGLRAYLALAGVDRSELLARGPTRRWITFHDLRATGITWMARGAERVVDRNGNDAEPTCGWCMVGLRPSRDWAGLTSEVAFVQEDRRRRLPTWLVDGPPVGDAWLLGLDASRWQGRLKGDALEGCNITTPTGRAIGSIGFAYFKATHGVGGVDPEFAANAASSAAMKRRGFYMWLVPTQDPIAQADHFVRTIRPYDRAHDLPPAIDFEDDGGGRVRDGALLDVARRCVERVEAQLGVRRAVVYTGRWFWIQACGDRDDAFFADRPLWHAQYPGHVPDVDEEPAIARPWASRGFAETFWQFDGDRGLVLPREATATGQPVDADFNRFRGDGPALDAFIASARRGPQSHGTTAT